MAELFEVYRARLHRVIDGDTYELDVDLGFGCWTRQVIRLQGLDAPEKNTGEGQRAIAYARQWFDEATGPPANGWVLVYPEKNTRGDFQRTFIRYVARVERVAAPTYRSLADDLRAGGHVKVKQ